MAETGEFEPKPLGYNCSCGCRFDYALGRYGCPNCLGDGRVQIMYTTQEAAPQAGGGEAGNVRRQMITPRRRDAN